MLAVLVDFVRRRLPELDVITSGGPGAGLYVTDARTLEASSSRWHMPRGVPGHSTVTRYPYRLASAQPAPASARTAGATTSSPCRASSQAARVRSSRCAACRRPPMLIHRRISLRLMCSGVCSVAHPPRLGSPHRRCRRAGASPQPPARRAAPVHRGEAWQYHECYA